jgi:uncharacterized Zn finger protein
MNWDCSCSYYGEHQVCKHIWATILEADHKGMLPDDIADVNGDDQDDDDDDQADIDKPGEVTDELRHSDQIFSDES